MEEAQNVPIPERTAEKVAEQFKVSHAKIWIINNQLARRNLTDTEFEYFIGKRFESEKQIGFKGNQYTVEENGVRQNGGDQTAEKIAEQFNLSPRKVERAAQFSEAVDTLEENVGVLGFFHHQTL